MQRVRILGGRLTGPQWIALAHAVRTFTPQTPIHLTTRQDIEFHNVTTQNTLPLQHALANAALTGQAGGGDGLRNITLCSCPQKHNQDIDLVALAQTLTARLLENPLTHSLPRKFKIALACGQPHCDAQPWINDLSFVLKQNQNTTGFQVIAAGSLGARPATGILLYPYRPAADILPIALAALAVFNQHGHRKNRARARLRHLRQDLGDQHFAQLLDSTLAHTHVEPLEPTPPVKNQHPLQTQHLRLPFPLGQLSPDAADALARIADLPGLSITITNHHNIVVSSPEHTQLRQILAAEPKLPQPEQNTPTIVACPGTTYCPRALTNTRNLAKRLNARLKGRQLPHTTICISGCPNGCAHSTVAPIGLVGRQTKIEGQLRQCYDLYLNGGLGRNPQLARLAARKLEPDDLLDHLTKKLLTTE